MTLPANFQFSQSSLHDWLTCRRRFEYRYLQRLAYPAPETSDLLEFEAHMQRGDDFHRLVQQHLVGVDAEVIQAHIDDPVLRGWWESYLRQGLTGLPENRYAETTLTVPLGGFRLLAKMDLIAAAPGDRIVIMDWKTSDKKPSRQRLERQMQTIVYRYVMVEAGAYYNGGSPVSPEQVEMVYWYTQYPNEPERFHYSTAQYEADRQYLQGVIGEIAVAKDFPKVDERDKDRTCRFCVYRSLCWDDVMAGPFAELIAEEEAPASDDFSFDIDLDQIAEIEF